MKLILFLMVACFSFSTAAYGAIAWSVPSAISTPLANASDPRVVVDANNNATAIWIENGVITANSLPSGGAWGTPVALSNPLNVSSNPKLGIDGAGNVTALWIENTQVSSAVLPAGGSWTAAAAPVSSAGASTPCLVVDSSGNAVAAWVRNGFVESATRAAGSWSAVAVLSNGNSSNPHVAISDSGTAIAVWHSVISGSDFIVTDLLTVSSNTWAATKNVFNGTAAFLHNYPKAAIDVHGNATVAWFRYNFVGGNSYQNVQVLSSSLTAGAAAWPLPQMLSNFGMRNPADLTLKLQNDPGGNTLLLWTNSYDGETFSVESTRKLYGGAWGEVVQSDVPNLYSLGVDLTNTYGIGLLTRMFWDENSAMVIRSQETDMIEPMLQAWTMPVTCSTGSDNGYPRCALSLTGNAINAVVVWMHLDGANTVIQTVTGADTMVAAPSLVSASQSVTDFGIYKDYHNTISWAASPAPNVIQYNLYRNGVFFTAVDPSITTLIDHNAVQGGTVVYGVAALSADFRQSAIATFTLVP